MGKQFKIVGEDISDGFHTFDELYEHRCLLFILLALKWPGRTYWRESGADWLLVGMVTPHGQITYHVSNKYRELVEGKLETPGPEWDSHTSADVLNRLLFWAESQEANTAYIDGRSESTRNVDSPTHQCERGHWKNRWENPCGICREDDESEKTQDVTSGGKDE